MCLNYETQPHTRSHIHTGTPVGLGGHFFCSHYVLGECWMGQFNPSPPPAQNRKRTNVYFYGFRYYNLSRSVPSWNVLFVPTSNKTTVANNKKQKTTNGRLKWSRWDWLFFQPNGRVVLFWGGWNVCAVCVCVWLTGDYTLSVVSALSYLLFPPFPLLGWLFINLSLQQQKEHTLFRAQIVVQKQWVANNPVGTLAYTYIYIHIHIGNKKRATIEREREREDGQRI